MDGLQASSPRIMVICHTAKRFTISLYRLLKAARFTAIVGSTSPHTQRLENMLLTLIYRACTKVMQRVAVCHAWLQRINNKSSINIFKCIALHLSVPVFHLNYLLFKFVHPIGQRRLLLDAGKIRDKSLRKLFLDSIDCGHNFKVVGHSMSGADQLAKHLGALDCSDDLTVHGVGSQLADSGQSGASTPNVETPAPIGNRALDSRFRRDEQ